MKYMTSNWKCILNVLQVFIMSDPTLNDHGEKRWWGCVNEKVGHPNLSIASYQCVFVPIVPKDERCPRESEVLNRAHTHERN